MSRTGLSPSPLFLALLGVTAGGAALTVVDSSVALTAGVVLLVLGGWAVSLCLHEFGHAITAYRGGDRSVVGKGYLTLDIRRYTEPVLSFVLPLILLLAGGIPLPGGAVWIDRSALRTRLRESVVSLAGPLTNLVLGALLIAAVATDVLPPGPEIGLSYLAFVQLLAFVLNILPVPGLDGFGIWEPYLAPGPRRLADKLRPWAPLALFVLIIGLAPLGQAFFGVTNVLFGALGGDGLLASAGLDEFLFWR